MTQAVRQIPLPLPVIASFDAADFLVTSSNREAVAWIGRWPEWPGRCLLLSGASGSGKSHLARIWAARVGAGVTAGHSLDLQAVLSVSEAVCIDDADACQNPAALFHLINRVREQSGYLLMTATAETAAWPHVLPDLTSRLRAMPRAKLLMPDDDLLAGIAAKLFADRQLTVPDGVIELMLARLERSHGAFAAAVAALDAAALASRRAITLPLARSVLQTSTES